MTDAILVLNAGSSSLKFRVYAVDASGKPGLMAKGQVEGLGVRPHFVARDAQGASLADDSLSKDAVSGHADALSQLATWLRSRYGGTRLLAVGHRVVHGGVKYATSVVVTDAVLAELERLVPLAPLHQPHNLAAIRAVQARLPQVPQVACFDTSFHRGHPELADRFALPETLYAEGVRRYGFHGLSYEYIARALPRVAPEIATGNVVVAHLGSGASMCALRAGKSVDSTLGFTALDGLPMGTRCGAIDPGVLLYLIAEKGMSAKAVERLLYKESGLIGLSGVSNDVRDLLESDKPGARLALDYFVYRINRELGALSAVLGGLDAIVFTAGIGENSPEIRARVCRAAAWMGIALDERRNRAGGPRITADGAAVSAWVIPTDEEGMIATHTLALVGRPAAAAS
ncbi:MAG: acetate/propionate family kinase [Alphaproteobacteria bacterium]|nr:acetate/propionate family kinase [Alphaproteobacteria bacterium]